MSSTAGKSWRWWVMVVAATLCSGCGKAAYDQLMEAKLNNLKFATQFLDNLHGQETDLESGVASLQLPKLINSDAKSFTTGAKNQINGNPIGKERIQPPFLNIPGYKFCYEKFVTVGRGDDLPYYCYFGVVDAKTQNQAAILNGIAGQLSKVFNRPTWRNVQTATPDGGQLEWKLISVKGKQIFETNTQGDSLEEMAGRFDIYVHSTPAYHVIVAYRSPDQVTAQEDIFDVGQLALGTLQVEEPVPAEGA